LELPNVVDALAGRLSEMC